MPRKNMTTVGAVLALALIAAGYAHAAGPVESGNASVGVGAGTMMGSTVTGRTGMLVSGGVGNTGVPGGSIGGTGALTNSIGSTSALTNSVGRTGALSGSVGATGTIGGVGVGAGLNPGMTGSVDRLNPDEAINGGLRR